ncbi:MAG: DUF362 domain-containing protein [Candidatus Anammoximicrobium sp.]|nr:DUF362 domain-containing protein [Candidatus Anammoximicrobium sp.]
MTHIFTRRTFLQHAAAAGGAVGLGRLWAGEPAGGEPQPLTPIGQARGVHPGRVVWVHDPEVTDWEGPGDGHWYQDNHTKQDHADQMVARAVCDLAGDGTPRRAWDKLFRHFNLTRGKGDVGYRPGEKIVIKPNWVGMIWREGAVDPETYQLVKRQDYMNTAPQMIIALLRQLVEAAGVAESDITICDTLAYLVNEYYEILHSDYPQVRYEDFAGRFGRIQVQSSTAPLYWSCRPAGVMQDYVPQCFAESEYLINFANLKAHTGAGVTLCAKNHFGSLVRWPVQKGYFDMHRASFSRGTQVYRELVDLMGHAHLGGKTVLYLLDGLYSGKHPIDPAPRRWASPPFDGQWAASLLASQDPVAIDSVAVDFLRAEWDDHPHRPGADEYLHEAALAHAPPSGTFYDPNHATPEKRLASLGVHEHWNNALEKKYSRNLGSGEGIELVSARVG